MHKRPHLYGLLSILAACALSLPALADETSPSVPEGFAAKFRQRIDNMKEQLDKGVTKGWVTPAKADELRQEISAVDAMEVEVRSKNWPKEPTNDLEKKVTLVNEHVSTAMSTEK
jgi:hypothetical protein